MPLPRLAADKRGNKSTMASTLPAAQDAALGRPTQCWECRRRRLVCDGTQPVCAKCRAARIVCPGYADKKPLTWLAPGQVVSRTRKRKTTRRDGNGSQPQATKAQCLDELGSDSQTDVGQPDALDFPVPFHLPTEMHDVFDAMIYCTLPGLLPASHPIRIHC